MNLNALILCLTIFPFTGTWYAGPPPTVESLEEVYIRSSHSEKVNVFRLLKEGQQMGHAVWIDRSGEQVNAKYFAFREGARTVHDRFQSWKSDKKVVVVCSGAFSNELPNGHNQNATTIGLTVDNGRIVNRSIDPSMDGLVIVYATGGIVVSDIENKNLRIDNQVVSVIEDKVRLMNWAVDKRATIFQTQLLAYENTLRISRAGRKKKRERRFLALVRSPRNEVYHVLVDIPKYNYLFDAARDVFYYLKDGKNMEVVALLNLDTGAYNVMELYDDRGSRDYDITGETDIKIATNLIAYHFSN